MLNLQELELFARKDNSLTQLHPLVKVIVTLIFVLSLTSLNKYELNKALLFGVIPIFLMRVADLDFRVLHNKMIIPIGFSISLGLLNPLFDREPLISFWIITLSGGMISLLTLVVKALFGILATLILVSTTTIEDIGAAMNQMHFPKMIILLLLIMYRYIVVFLNEIEKTLEAYSLRTSDKKGIHISTWGSLVGQIMIRSYRRAQTLYEAMELRGFKGEYVTQKVKKIRLKDNIFMSLCIMGIIIIRVI